MQGYADRTAPERPAVHLAALVNAPVPLLPRELDAPSTVIHVPFDGDDQTTLRSGRACPAYFVTQSRCTMARIPSALSVIALVLLILSSTGAARAAHITWVSGATAGNDANPCTRSQPCRTLDHAYTVTDAGGEIDILDGGSYTVTFVISQSITIVNTGAGVATVGHIQINTSSTDEVILRGLNFSPTYNSAGVWTYQAGSVIIDHCTFHYYGVAIHGVPTGSAKIRVVDTVISNSGFNSTAAVLLQPASGGSETLQLERVQIVNSIGNGIRVDTTQGGSAFAELHHVTVDGATGGSAIVAVTPTSGGPKATIVANTVTSENNTGYGFRAVGGTAKVILRRSMITNNSVGIGVGSGGQIFSYGDNGFSDNTGGDGVTPTPIGLK